MQREPLRASQVLKRLFDHPRDPAMSAAPWLCYAACAAPLCNILALAVAAQTGQLAYPNLSLSDVICCSPGLNVVAAGWTTFAACYATLCFIQHELLTRAAQVVPELEPWIDRRLRVSVGLIFLMSAVHLVPLPAYAPLSPPWETLEPSRDAAHFAVAGSYATAGVLEAWLLVRCIEPLLRSHGLLATADGRWLRSLILFISPGWCVVAVLGAVGLHTRHDATYALACVIEFGIISIYGTYPIALLGLIRDLQRRLPLVLGKGSKVHGAASRQTPRRARAARSRSPARVK